MFVGTIIGNIGKDAELKYISSGKPVVNFSVASTKKSKDGEETTWVNISYFGANAEKIASYLVKGKQVGVTGDVRNRPYEKDGATRYSLELTASFVQLLGSKGDGTTQADVAGSAKQYQSTETSPF